jgi:hypothetical protein
LFAAAIQFAQQLAQHFFVIPRNTTLWGLDMLPRCHMTFSESLTIAVKVFRQKDTWQQ